MCQKAPETLLARLQGPIEQLKGRDTQLWRQAAPTQNGGLDCPAAQTGGARQVGLSETLHLRTVHMLLLNSHPGMMHDA